MSQSDASSYEYGIEYAEQIYARIPPVTAAMRMRKRSELGRMAFVKYPHMSAECRAFIDLANNGEVRYHCACPHEYAETRGEWLREMLDAYGLIETYKDDVAELSGATQRMAKRRAWNKRRFKV